MDRSLYIAMNGAKQTQLAQAANANNLGHAQSAGFRADFQQFRAMPEFGPGYPSRVYSMTERPGSDFTPGTIQTTGRDLDAALMDSDGWFAIVGEDGKEAYSKAGNLTVTLEGNFKTGDGSLLLNDAGAPIAIPPAKKIDIGRDGTISVIPEGADSNTLVAIDRIKLVKSGGADLYKGGDGLMYTRNGELLPANGDMRLQTGAVENSNVNIVVEMVKMLELGRHFELENKVMKTVDNNSAMSAKLMQMA